MKHDVYDDAHLVHILATVRSIAILGASPNEMRPSYNVTSYLIERGYRVFPINPGQEGKKIAGAMTYAWLADLPEPVDMVDIFRAASALPGITDEILAMEPLPKIVWMQLDIRNDACAIRLENAGIDVVMDRCPKIEYERLYDAIIASAKGDSAR